VIPIAVRRHRGSNPFMPPRALWRDAPLRHDIVGKLVVYDELAGLGLETLDPR
jgi:hypothetical protein